MATECKQHLSRRDGIRRRLQATQRTLKQYPVMTIRAITNIVGLELDPRWTKYACQTAASFAFAFITADIIKTRDSSTPTPPVSLPPTQQKSTKSPPKTSTANSSKPVPFDIFISYSAHDESFKEELKKYLTMLSTIDINIWNSQYKTVGQKMVTEIDPHLLSAKIILLLISSDFLASDYLYEIELGRALEQQREGIAQIIPIYLRYCDLTGSPIEALPVLPSNGMPVTAWSNRDEAWGAIVREIRDISNDLISEEDFQAGISIITQSNQIATTRTPPYIQIFPLSDKIYTLGEVFVQKGLPTITFVESADFKYLKQDLRPEGRSIVIEGPSGIGKTSAIRRAKAALGPSISEPKYLSVRKEENREQLRTLESWHKGTLIIDDFHCLDERLYRQIADYLKYLADADETDSTPKKLIIIGIPHCGQTLIDMAPDLTTRISLYIWKAASNEMILELIEKGEKALNIIFASKAEIVQTASGSLFIAQSLCYNLCTEAGIQETQPATTTINCPIEDGERRTKEELTKTFRSQFCALQR